MWQGVTRRLRKAKPPRRVEIGDGFFRTGVISISLANNDKEEQRADILGDTT
jgi:hypothetical protein